MLLMNVKNVNYSIGTKQFFSIDELSIYRGDRIGLIGKNGQGKSLLLQYLFNLTDQKPSVEWFGTKEYFKQLRSEEMDSYLSGGEKTIKGLNSIFSKKPDLLFLDEPSNNLDWNRIEELEKRLQKYNGAFVLVSHDRALLNTVCNKIWELEEGQFSQYEGNYNSYHEQKERELHEHEEKFQAYQKEKKRLQERYYKKQQQAKNMDRPPSRMGNSEWQLYKNKAAGKRGKVERVSTVLKERIERLEKVEKPFEWDSVKMDYVLQTPIHKKTLLQCKELEKTIEGQILYKTKGLKLKTGSKTALIGSNGSGKTTLINQLFAEGEEIEVAQNVKVGYFHQSIEALPHDETILQFVEKGSTLPKHIIRIILARLRFFENDVNKSINILSGGERVKVAIAKLLVGDYNLLILDEPTNHIDLDTLKAIEGLINDYPGTVLVVSHDREFVQRTAEKLWIIKDQKVSMFDGSIEFWQRSKQKPKRLEKNEAEILTLETKLSELLSRLSIPSPKDDFEELDKQYQDVLRKLRQIKEVKDE
ncbi:ATPase subunit of ABC transporter with duplicated ATPase domains [Bacillus pakistanensis]|uniref:ATPase subunit of ABC transporter with duplicated ATPase domains n=1 Tax=Rossellomorea pakistanensis TaxID=992288 RepID=A0ABS2N8G8_9BACI|nr:ABC-F family ATP-binding cassette domain-containing protein [Bacillus pakistanensis]MBM7584151.1 ATPase subunit of ABC transporter with duplicated ATPase domains [Bacillus pakistanensis]